MRDISEINDKVEVRKLQLQPLFIQDQENYDLWAGKEQIFDTHPMSVNITGTEMTALGRRTQASAVRSRVNIQVLAPKGLNNPDAGKEANQEERMHYYGFNKADERLTTLGEPKLLPAMAWQAIVLGRITVRILVYKDKKTGEIIWDYLPLNPAFVTFSFDDKGLAWYRYESFRSPASIKSQYNVDVQEDIEGRGVSVSDHWDREHNVVYLTKNKIGLGKVLDNSFEEVPMIFQPVAGGPKAIDEQGINVVTWGQSIYDPVKSPFTQLNELRSIAATHAHLKAKAPLDVTYTGDKPGITDKHFERYPGAVFEHPDTTTIKHLDESEIPVSLMAMMGDVQTGIQRLTGAELHPEWAGSSGAALRIAGQDRHDVNAPRIDTLDTTYTRICKMAKKQIVVRKLTIPVRTVSNGEYEIFDIKPKLLDNDFYINAKLIKQDVYDEVEALSEAQMLQDNRWMSREDIMEKKLGIQDVPTQLTKMKIEELEAGIPELNIPDVVKAYEEMGLPDKAKIAIKQLGLLEAEKMQTVMPQEQGQPPGGTQR